MESFPITYHFAEKYVRFSNPEYLQLYLYLAYQTSKNSTFPSTEQIAKDLAITAERATFMLDFWVSRDELTFDGKTYRFAEAPQTEPKAAPQVRPHRGKQSTRPSYTMAEIDSAAAGNKSVSALFYQAESVLNKVLTQSDMEMLYSFMDWLGLPVEVITMLLSYAAKRGKTNRRYLETVAIDWAERGIDTFDAAEAYITVLEQSDNREHEIRNILGIYDRALTSTEKKYIKLWTEDTRITPELISLAYDRTVTHTGKLSWAYMNKILSAWAEAGLTDAQAVVENDRPPAKNTAPVGKKSPFANYTDTNQTDYEKLEQQLFDMLDREE